jgi:hypothetical protein
MDARLMGESSNPSIQPSPIWVRFFPHPKFKGLGGLVLGSFQRPIKSKGLSGLVLGSSGFVPGVNSLILNYLVASFDPFWPFSPLTPSSGPVPSPLVMVPGELSPKWHWGPALIVYTSFVV